MTATPAPTDATTRLRVRWLGTVPYGEALALQQGLFSHGRDQHLLLLEHPHVFTYGPRTDLAANLRCDPAAVGAELVPVKRGGDVTYHGPGQLVGYPIVSVANSYGASDHVCAVQRVVVGALHDLGLTSAGCLPEYPGVWIDPDGPNPRKICAIGVRLSHGRTMHGFALNVTTDLTYMRDHIVPCGIADKPVTSIAEEFAAAGTGREITMREVADAIVRRAAEVWGDGVAERQDVALPVDDNRGSRDRRSLAVRDRARRCAPRPITASGPRRCGCATGSTGPGCRTASRSRPASPSGCGPRWCTGPRCCR